MEGEIRTENSDGEIGWRIGVVDHLSTGQICCVQASPGFTQMPHDELQQTVSGPQIAEPHFAPPGMPDPDSGGLVSGGLGPQSHSQAFALVQR